MRASSINTFTRRDLVAVLVIVSVAALLVLPLFLRGFPEGPDLRHHYRCAYYFCEELREGAIYPRWLAGANRGYGSPVMFYYPPLTFYVVAAFYLAAKNLLLAITLSCVLSMMMSGVSMYIFSRTMLSRAASVAAAALYMGAPYHFFDLWRGSALSEYWSFVWIPLVLAAIERIAAGAGWRASAYLALSYGLLLLTHVPASLIVTAILPVYVLALTRDKRKLIQAVAGITLGASISAVFLVSVLFETKHVHIDRILENAYIGSFLFEDFGANFRTNLLSAANYPAREGYVAEANLVAAGLALLLIVVSAILLIEWRAVREAGSRRAAARAVWLVAIVTLLMTTRITEPLWSAIRPLQYLQSPLRWLVPATAATVLLTAIALQTAVSIRGRRFVYAVPVCAAIVLNIAISAHVATQRPAVQAQLENRLRQRDVPEYAPLWWDEVFHEEFEQASVVVAQGDADVNAIDDAGLKQSYEVSARTEATIKFRSVFFPGWSARVDGKRVDIGRSTEGNVQLIVAPGDHSVMLKFEETWRHIKADVVSGASVLILAAMFFATRRSTRKSANAHATSTVGKIAVRLERP